MSKEPREQPDVSPCRSVRYPERSLTCGRHVLRGLDGLEPDEGDLHGAEEPDDEEGVVGHVDALQTGAQFNIKTISARFSA